MKQIIFYLKYIFHKLKIFIWFFLPKKTKLDLFGSSMISLTGRWRTEFDPFLTYISMFSIMRQREFKGSFLEFGGGYSTILAIQVLTGMTNFKSIDMNPSKYFRILNSMSNYSRFSNYVEIIPEITVSFEEVKNSYKTLKKEFLKYEVSSVEKSLRKFTGDSSSELMEIIFDKNDESLLNFIKKHDSFINEEDFYIKNNMLSGNGYCKKILEESESIDAIFYDCGEISSNAEWFETSKLIPKGGYALLHDIFYPKSIKNVFLASLINLSDDWEIIYIDDKSPQGGLMAQRR
ncbi:MAG: hypothetical protein CMQ76_04570 [Gammaproteobacteria bacterium]|nr:hypothetical protein [Gammaproteobacteria bacterium]|tara:strand:- start:493 stop:1365 length:873 start_codon:yes stop_codon:yes gene_type:complete